MQGRLSRRKLAAYVADNLVAEEKSSDVLRELAAYLIESRRIRESELMIRAVEDALEERGVTVATVTTASPLSTELRENIQQLISSRDIQLCEVTDPSIIGGVRIETPSSTLDATIKRKLLALGRAKQ